MSVGARIAAALLAIVLILALSSAWLLRVAGSLVEQNRILAEVDVEALALGLQTWSRLGELEELLQKHAALQDERYLEEATRIWQIVDADLETLESLSLGTELRDAATRLREPWPGTPSAGGAEVTATAVPVVRDRLADFLRTARSEMRRAAETSAEETAHARNLAWGVAAVALVLAGLLAALLGRSVVAPLRRLGRASRSLADGDFSARVDERGPREIAGLARDFNTMATELGELDALKRDLVSNVSHDLKAPLASMQETTRLLLDRVPGNINEQQERLLRLNLESGERLSEMIVNVLDLSRLEANAADPRTEAIDVERLLGRVRSDLASFASRREVSIVIDLTEDLPPLEVDADLARRALVNVVHNGIRFSPQGSALRIGARRSGPTEAPAVTIEVVDRGRGVPDHHKERIFERFHRADPEQRGAQGTGLGLAISRAIARLHGGAIWVEDAEGGGSRFVLRLPACAVGLGDSERVERRSDPSAVPEASRA